MSTQTIGIIGGSGLYEMPGLKVLEEKRLKTPFGDPSDAYVIGELEGRRVIFLSRHGRGHKISPSEINYRANIYGMKQLGVDHIIAVSAVGSLREDIHPGHFVIIDQFYDRTKDRPSTFFTDGVVAHVSFADPICQNLATIVHEACKKSDVTSHFGGTYVCMEGPAFSTRAESHSYRALKASVIGMTNLQEAKLAREAEICFATIALSTDYDCWKADEVVDVSKVVATVKANVANAQQVVRHAIPLIGNRACDCDRALQYAIMTSPQAIPAAAKDRLGIFINKYIKG